MNGETTLNVVDQTEVFTGLVNGDDIYKTESIMVNLNCFNMRLMFFLL